MTGSIFSVVLDVLFPLYYILMHMEMRLQFNNYVQRNLKLMKYIAFCLKIPRTEWKSTDLDSPETTEEWIRTKQMD